MRVLALVAVVFWYFVPWGALVPLGVVVYMQVQARVAASESRRRVVHMRMLYEGALLPEEWEYLRLHAVFFTYPSVTRMVSGLASALAVFVALLGLVLVFSGRWAEVGVAVLIVLLCVSLSNLSHPFLAAQRAQMAESQGRLTGESIEKQMFDRIVASLTSAKSPPL